MTKKEKYEKRWEVFRKIWKTRKHISQLSGKPIYGELKSFYMDHLLERSTYPALEFTEWNIIIVTQEEHSRKTRGFPGKEQETDKKYKELIQKAKERYEKETYSQT